MKKLLLLVLIVILSLNSFSQISFEEGYYIDNSDQKVDCLIKNNDWNNNPTKFEYKLTENAEQKTLTLKSVKEFGIYNVSKYIRYIVNIDRSSNLLNDLSNVRNPIFLKEEHFLKVLIEGKANLYSFVDGNLIRYFFNKDDSVIEQLIFKKYRTSGNNIAINNRFKQQLSIDLKCPCISNNSIEKVDYTRTELVKFFENYNECIDSEFINFNKKRNKDLFNLTLRAGLNSSSLSIDNNASNYRDTDFGNELGFRIGTEAEFIMPFNKNKWAIIIEPTYQYFKSEKESSHGKVTVADYKSIELPLGVRYYLFLNNISKIFINGSSVVDFSRKSKIDFGSSAILEIKTGLNLAFGMGYKHNNKYSLELRYQTNRDIFYNYLHWKSDYNTLSVILGYTIF